MPDKPETSDPPTEAAGSGATDDDSVVNAFLRGLARFRSETNEPETLASEPVPPPRSRRKKGLVRKPGRRPMKEYPLTDSDMEVLSQNGFWASLSFAGTTGLAGFALNIHKDVDLATGSALEVVGFWNGVQVACWVGAGALLVLTIVFASRRGLKMQTIRNETEFDED